MTIGERWSAAWSWWRQLVADLAVDRARIVLVLLGVVWGTLSLTIVLAFGGSFTTAMGEAIHATGDDLFRLSAGATTRPFAGMPAGRRVDLVASDAQAVVAAVPAVVGASIEYTSFTNPVLYGGQRRNVRVHGVDPSYGELRHFTPAAGGRFIDRLDVLGRRRVAFVGTRLRRDLFGDRPAVGEHISLWGQPFLVVGVMSKRIRLGYYDGEDRDKILIPATTFQALRGSRAVDYLIFRVRDKAEQRMARDGVYRVLGRRHGFDPEDLSAVRFRDNIAMMHEASSMVAGLRALMVVVAILGMLVALVGVANVMYVMVEERRVEIGIRMALGARPARIAGERVGEAVIVTVGGAVLGVAVSAGVLALLGLIPLDENARGYLGTPAVSIGTALAVAGSLGLAGGLAGWVPARRAALIQPVEALRDD